MADQDAPHVGAYAGAKARMHTDQAALVEQAQAATPTPGSEEWHLLEQHCSRNGAVDCLGCQVARGERLPPGPGRSANDSLWRPGGPDIAVLAAQAVAEEAKRVERPWRYESSSARMAQVGTVLRPMAHPPVAVARYPDDAGRAVDEDPYRDAASMYHAHTEGGLIAGNPRQAEAIATLAADRPFRAAVDSGRMSLLVTIGHAIHQRDKALAESERLRADLMTARTAGQAYASERDDARRELAASRGQECSALCRDIEADRDQLVAALDAEQQRRRNLVFDRRHQAAAAAGKHRALAAELAADRVTIGEYERSSQTLTARLAALELRVVVHEFDEPTAGDPTAARLWPASVGGEPQEVDLHCVCGAPWAEGECSSLAAEVVRLRQHSAALNSICYRVAQALGDVTGGETAWANPESLLDRLMARVGGHQCPVA